LILRRTIRHRPIHAFVQTLAFSPTACPTGRSAPNPFFVCAARQAPECSFLFGGSGWQDKFLPSNVRYAAYVAPTHYNAFNSSPLAVLNVSRESIARYGYSPATRVFEAAGACLITDAWKGIELFLEPDREVLVAEDGVEVASILRSLDETRARAIGAAALRRVTAHHTYAHRAAEWDAVVNADRKPLVA
jgi:spore maturation protein CgeB